jgi:NDP-sugar pyrophosphorylase family protein
MQSTSFWTEGSGNELALLRNQGIKRVVLCVGHQGDMIKAEFGDGARFGIGLEYSFDGPRLTGTGGAVRKALPLLGNCFLSCMEIPTCRSISSP